MKSQLSIRVTPRSAKPGIGGWRAGAEGREELEVRVTEALADGSANAAVIRLVAKALDVPRSAVGIVSGQASRHKRISVPLHADEVARRLRS